MNIVPMFVGTFLPWGIFVFCCGLASFWLNYVHPRVVDVLIGVVFVFWLLLVSRAYWARTRDPDPTWFSYMALAVGIAAIAGTLCGEMNFTVFSQPYYQVKDLKVVDGVDASVTPARNMLDAGIVTFVKGNHFDVLRSWHFKNGVTYCVAPMVSPGAMPTEYNFWVVGKDCCSLAASDFRCGAWGNDKAHSGIRVVRDDDLASYKLAVMQAQSLYDIEAPSPIFLTLASDPSLEVSSWNQQVFKNYMTQVGTALVCCFFFVCMATVRFAWIGRSPSAYVSGPSPL
jgi:succinate dehydrogenase hydrophobic anchor subunit